MQQGNHTHNHDQTQPQIQVQAHVQTHAQVLTHAHAHAQAQAQPHKHDHTGWSGKPRAIRLGCTGACKEGAQGRPSTTSTYRRTAREGIIDTKKANAMNLQACSILAVTATFSATSFLPEHCAGFERPRAHVSKEPTLHRPAARHTTTCINKLRQALASQQNVPSFMPTNRASCVPFSLPACCARCFAWS